jgi:hypothetical protein
MQEFVREITQAVVMTLGVPVLHGDFCKAGLVQAFRDCRYKIRPLIPQAGAEETDHRSA